MKARTAKSKYAKGKMKKIRKSLSFHFCIQVAGKTGTNIIVT
jgi:hypothetical protein